MKTDHRSQTNHKIAFVIKSNRYFNASLSKLEEQCHLHARRHCTGWLENTDATVKRKISFVAGVNFQHATNDMQENSQRTAEI